MRSILAMVTAAAICCSGCCSPTEPTPYFLYVGLNDGKLKEACDDFYIADYRPTKNFRRSYYVDQKGNRWKDVCCTMSDHGFHWNVGSEKFGEASVAVNFGEASECR